MLSFQNACTLMQLTALVDEAHAHLDKVISSERGRRGQGAKSIASSLSESMGAICARLERKEKFTNIRPELERAGSLLLQCVSADEDFSQRVKQFVSLIDPALAETLSPPLRRVGSSDVRPSISLKNVYLYRIG